ncbi:MAG: hypothetical protein AAGE96_22800 [Cyanobacteria bacterium P01_G01_bin.19]
MTLTNIAQSSSDFQLQQLTGATVYEYALTVANVEDNDTQQLTAAFTSIPTLQDWLQWLDGWFSCGYSLQSTPQLVRAI